jgi:hypothetical protein
MFIDKTLIIVFTNIHSIYIKRKEGGKRLDAGETERECVCERDGALLKMEVTLVVKMAVEKQTFWDKLGSRWKDYLIAGKLF